MNSEKNTNHYQQILHEFNKSVDQQQTHFEKCLYVLKNLHKLEALPDKLKEKTFERVFEIAEIAKFTKDEFQQYEDSLKYYRDLKNSIDTAKSEAIANREVEIITNALATGLDHKTIASITGFSVEKIQEIIKSNQLGK